MLYRKREGAPKQIIFCKSGLLIIPSSAKINFVGFFFLHFDAKKIKVDKLIAKYFVLFDDFSKWSALK